MMRPLEIGIIMFNDIPEMAELMSLIDWHPAPEFPSRKRKLIAAGATVIGAAAVVASWAALERKINAEND